MLAANSVGVIAPNAHSQASFALGTASTFAATRCYVFSAKGERHRRKGGADGGIREAVPEVGISHVQGCSRRRCACVRVTDGFEYEIKFVLPNGEKFSERKKSPVKGEANTWRYGNERFRHVMQESVAPRAAAPKKEVPTVAAFEANCPPISIKPTLPSGAPE